VILLGDLYMALGQREKALISYQKAVEVNADSVSARDKLIDHYLDTGQLDEAERHVTPILEKNAKDLAGRFFDARLRLARGQADDAIERLQGVLRDEPRSALAHQFLGLALAEKHEGGQARRKLSEAVKLAPTLAESRTELAAMYAAEGSYDLAIEEAQAAVRIKGRNVRAAVVLGEAYLRKGEVAKGRQAFEAIVEAIPNDSSSLYRLGLIARADKKEAQALSYFERALAANPHLIEPLSQIAAIRLGQGKREEARERVTRQLKVSPDNPLIYSLLGRLWLEAKDESQVEASLKKAIALNNAFSAPYLDLAALYLRAGTAEQAVQEYAATLAKNPKVLSAQALLGMIHEQRKEYERAKSRYEEALKLDPGFAPAARPSGLDFERPWGQH
jgi:tetratricopeptide (TPR) repeat protein